MLSFGGRRSARATEHPAIHLPRITLLVLPPWLRLPR
jgi:hypothetical protein